MAEKLNATYNERIALLDKLNKAVTRNGAQALKELELTGASEEKLHQQRLKNLESSEKINNAAREAEVKRIRDLRATINQYRKQGNDEEVAANLEELKASQAKYDELVGQHKDYSNQKRTENLDYKNKKDAEDKRISDEEDAKYKERAAKYKSFLQKRLSVQQEIEDIRLSLIADGEFKEIEILNVNAQRKKDALLADTTVSQDQKESLIRWYEAQRQAEEQKIRDTYIQKEIELAQKVAEAKAIQVVPPPEPDFAIPEEDAVNPEIEAEKFTQSELRRIRNEAREEDAAAHAAWMQDKIDKSAGYFEAASQSLQALDDLNSLLTDNAVKKAGANEAAAEAARKKGFERSKKLQITMAVIQGVQGVMSAFTAGSSMGPAGVVMGPLMAALAAVTAGVNIAKIKATKYEGGGGGSPAVPTSVPNPASFNVVGDSGTNQIAETLGQQNANPTKAYVVAGDVTSAQSLERNKIANASM